MPVQDSLNLDAMNDWQAIETAPREMLILVAPTKLGAPNVAIGLISEHHGRQVLLNQNAEDRTDWRPSHWRLLPPPPKR